MILKNFLYIILSLLSVCYCKNQFYFKTGNCIAKETTISVQNSEINWIISLIFQIIAKERLGYETIAFDLWNGGSIEDSLKRLQCNDDNCSSMPKAHVDLAVRIPPGSSKAYTAKIENLGPLGPVTEFGLFASQNFLDKVYREKNVHLNYWRDRNQLIEADIQIPQWLFDDLQNELVFKPLWNTKCSSLNCLLIITDREESVDYLRLQLIFETSNEDQKDELILDVRLINSINPLVSRITNDANAMDSSFFILTSFPNTATINSSLSRVYLHVDYATLINFIEKESTHDLYCRNCDTYQGMHQLNKFTWTHLAQVSPWLHKLATFMRLSTLDYIQFLRSITLLDNEERKVEIFNIDGTTSRISIPNIEKFYAIACDWVRDNSDEWAKWTETFNQHQNLTIALLIPAYGKWRTENLPKVADKALTDYQSSDAESEYKFVLEPYKSQCDDSKGLEDYMKATEPQDGKTLIAVVAALCSDSIASIALMSNLTRRIVISPTVETAKHQFSYFFRVVPSITGINFAMIYFIKYHNWRRIGIIRKDDLFLKASIFKNCGLEVVDDVEVQENTMTYEIIYSRLKLMKEKQTKIFLVEFFSHGSAKVMCAAYNLGMTHENGYVFFLNPWLKSQWFEEVPGSKCSNETMRKATQGVFYVAHRVDIYIPEFSSDETTPLTSYEFYMEDSIRLILSTFKNLLKMHPSAASDITNKTVANDFRKLIFKNPKGFEFNDANQRVGTSWDVRQAKNEQNLTYELSVFNFSIPNSVRVPSDPDSLTPNELFEAYSLFSNELQVQNLSSIYWGSGKNRKIPNDGGVRYLCSVGILAEYFNLDCNTTIILLSIACCTIPLLSIISFCILYYRKKAKIAEKNNKKPFEDLCHELAHIEIPKCDILLNREIGCGAFGRVFGGEAKSQGRWEAVAVKRMSKNSNYEGKMEFLSEAKLMNRIKHRNVVRLVGVGLKGDHLYIVMEFLLYGDLKTFLLSRRYLVQKNEPNDIVCPLRLTQMAKDIASGVEYLHSNQLIHRDIACRNCLVGEDYTVKIGDFGLTREATLNDRTEAYYRFTRSCQLPIRWMAPEAIELGVFSPKSDMWSYGILLYEIVTFGVFPYSPLCDIEVVERVKRNGFSITEFLPPAAKDTPIWNLIIHLCQYCWQHRPDSMQSVVDIFEENPEMVQPFLTEDPPKIINEDYTTTYNVNGSSEHPDPSQHLDQIYSSLDQLHPINNAHHGNKKFVHQVSEPYGMNEQNKNLIAFDRKNSTKSCLDHYSTPNYLENQLKCLDKNVKTTRQLSQNYLQDPLYQQFVGHKEDEMKCEHQENYLLKPNKGFNLLQSGQMSAPLINNGKNSNYESITNEKSNLFSFQNVQVNASCMNLSMTSSCKHTNSSCNLKSKQNKSFLNNATSALKTLLGVSDPIQRVLNSKTVLSRRYIQPDNDNQRKVSEFDNTNNPYSSLPSQPLLSSVSGPAINTCSNSTTSTTIKSSLNPTSVPGPFSVPNRLSNLVKDDDSTEEDTTNVSIRDRVDSKEKLTFYFLENDLDVDILP